MAVNMATGDPIYNTGTVLIGMNGVTITNQGHYTAPNYQIGMNLHGNNDFQHVFSRLVSLENEVFALRKKLAYMETNPALEEQFESLKRAGEEYRLIEKLVFRPTGERNGTS